MPSSRPAAKHTAAAIGSVARCGTPDLAMRIALV
jgi:hypothetical protein